MYSTRSGTRLLARGVSEEKGAIAQPLKDSIIAAASVFALDLIMSGLNLFEDGACLGVNGRPFGASRVPPGIVLFGFDQPEQRENGSEYCAYLPVTECKG